MAQFSLTESLPPKKLMVKAWQKILKHDQLFAIPLGKNPVFVTRVTMAGSPPVAAQR